MFREKIIKKIIADKDILDIGSIGQTGEYLLWELYKTVKIKSLTGIDLPNAKETALNNFNITNKDLNNDIRIVCGDMETYEFNKKFDVIIAGDVIEHVNNQGLFLKNIHNHLRDDGKLVITTPNAKWLTAIMPPNPTHVLWHDKYTLTRILKLNGFKIDSYRYYYGNKKKYNIFIRPLVARQGIIVICSINK